LRFVPRIGAMRPRAIRHEKGSDRRRHRLGNRDRGVSATRSFSAMTPPPLKFDAIGVKLQAPLGGSSEGRVAFFCLLIASLELVRIVFALASEFLWLKTCELPLKLCELLLNLSELPH
jgi:hypothetical protein